MFRRLIAVAAAAGCLAVAPIHSARAVDPNSGTWSAPATFAGYLPAMAFAPLAGGGSLAVGGNDTENYESSNRTYIYSAFMDQWRAGPTLFQRRHGALATLLQDGRVFVAGGVARGTKNSLTQLQSTEIVDVRAGKVAAGPTLPFLGLTKLVTLADGRVFGSGPNGRYLLGDPATGVPLTEVFKPAGALAALFDGAADPWLSSAGLTKVPGAMVRLTTGDVLAVAPRKSGGDARWAALLRNGSTTWSAIAAPRTNFADQLVVLGAGHAMLTGGYKETSNPTGFLTGGSSTTRTPVRVTEIFDVNANAWAFAEEAPQDVLETVGVVSGRALIAGTDSVLFSPEGIEDDIPARSIAKAGPANDVSPIRVYGNSVDADSGVKDVYVTFTGKLALGKKVTVKGFITGCDDDKARHRCNWTAKSPLLKPGTYSVYAWAVDRAGNVEPKRGERAAIVL